MKRFIFITLFIISNFKTHGQGVNLALSRDSIIIPVNHSDTFRVEVIPFGGFTQQISFQYSCLSGNCSGINISFNPNPVNHPYINGTVATVAINGSCIPGDYLFLITGANGPFSVSETISIKARPLFCNFFDVPNQQLFGNGYSITKDKSNNLWFGFGSLVKYDRTNWTNYTTVNSQLPGTILSMIADSLNGIWMATVNGVCHFDGTFWTIFNPSNSGLTSAVLSDLTFDLSGNLWISANNDPQNNYQGGGLYKYDGTIWTHYDSTNSLLPNNKISSVSIDKNGTVWAISDPYSSTYNSIIKYDGLTWTTFNPLNSCLPYLNRISKISFDSQNNAWFTGGYLSNWPSTPEVGVYKMNNTVLEVWNDSSLSTYNHRVYNNSCSIISQDNSTNVSFLSAREIIVDPNDNVYVESELGSGGNGLLKYFSENWDQFTKMNSSLFRNAVLDMFYSEDTLWVTSAPDYIFGGDQVQYFICADQPIPTFEHEINNSDIHIFPVPSDDYLTIEFDLNKTSEYSVLTIYDLNGALVIHQRIESQVNKIDVRKLSSGMYLYSIVNELSQIHGKFIVQR